MQKLDSYFQINLLWSHIFLKIVRIKNYTQSPPAEEEECHDDNDSNDNKGSHGGANNDAHLSVVFVSYIRCKHTRMWGHVANHDAQTNVLSLYHILHASKFSKYFHEWKVHFTSYQF